MLQSLYCSLRCPGRQLVQLWTRWDHRWATETADDVARARRHAALSVYQACLVLVGERGIKRSPADAGSVGGVWS
nr:hypothetical protein CFP56_04008 [Quercus suber]